MGKRKSNPNMKLIRQRQRYWKKKRGVDTNASIILSVAPKYVVKEFKDVKKLHGTKYAVRFLKAKFGRRKRR